MYRQEDGSAGSTPVLPDLLAVAEDEGGDPSALVCLLALNGLRVSQVCEADIADLGGLRYQPTLQVIGKGYKPALIVLNPRTYQAIDQAISGRAHAPVAAQPSTAADAAAQRRSDHPASLRQLASLVG
jgi:hypothetical protein